MHEILGPDDCQETTEIRNRIRAAWATFRKYRQVLTSKKLLAQTSNRLLDAMITPTICYASGTWTPTKEHEIMTQSTQRKMLRLIIHTKRRYKKIVKQKDKTNEEKYTNDMSSTCDESEDGQSSNTHNDQDSDVSFENDTDEEINTTEIDEEDWIEYVKRSTDDAIEKMDNAKIRCWNKTHKQMIWRLALRIAASPSERWLMKASEWNPKLSSKYRTNRAIGRPRKRWEDDINEFLKLVEDERENFIESSTQINKTWINTAKDRGRWTLLEDKYTMTSEERHDNNARTRMRRNNQSRPARYVNGVRQQLRNQFRMQHPNEAFGKQQQQLCNQELRDG